MRKKRKRCMICLLLTLCLLFQTLPASAAADEPYYETEEAVNSNYRGEYVSVYTPYDEPCAIYVQGKLRGTVTMLRLTLATDGLQIIRAFVRPDSAGEFSVRIDTSAGNRNYPSSFLGEVVADETGGQTGGVCYDTMPGYKEVPAVSDALCRLSICCAYTDEQADGVYDGSWYDSSNPLSGNMGFTSSEFVFHMVDNDPKVVVYSAVLEGNTSIRSAYEDMSIGGFAYDVFTDPYLKDIEGYMRSASVSRPLLQGQVEYLYEQAEIVTAGAETDYDKVLRIFEFAADNFYYDYLGFYTGPQVQYCNPYENILALRSGASGPNCINGKVGTVCNGYSAIIIALCRAEGIPARMVCGYNGSGNIRVWNSIDADYRNVKNHWWAEAYVDGRWLIMDADKGSKNEWRREDGDWTVEDNACWARGNALSYSGFDMNEEQLASNYCYGEICSRNNPELREPFITSVDTSSGYVTLRWEPVDGATGYYIYRGTVPETESLSYYSSCSTTEFTSYGVPGEAGKELEEPGVTYYYRVRSVNNGTEGGRSNLVSATVSEEERESAVKAPVITAQPADVSVRVGQTAVFTVTAVGADLSYRWQYYADADGGWINTSQAGFDTDTLSVPATLARNGYQYRCKVSNAVGTVYSDAATLTVEQAAPPVILTQPASVEALEGETAAFTVEAEGEDLSYRWEYRPTENDEWDYTYQTGYRTATLSVPATAARSGYQYRCLVSNDGGTVTSDPATLTVVRPDPPVIVRQPLSLCVTAHETAVFSLEAAGADLSYCWYYRTGEDGDLQVYQGEGFDGPAISLIADNDKDGWQFSCLVENSDGSVWSDMAILSVEPVSAPQLLSQPVDVQAKSGETVSFSVEASGYEPEYQWQYRASASGSWKNCSGESSRTACLSLEAKAYRNGYQYRCVVSNEGGSVQSEAAELCIVDEAPPVITRQPASVSAQPGDQVAFSLAASGSNLCYQWQYRTSGTGVWNNSSAADAKTASYAVKAALYRNGYQYRCIVSNDVGSVTSETATLTVSEAAAPVILVQPQSQNAAVGSTAHFSVEASGSGLSYRWQFRSGAAAAWKDCSGEGAATSSLPIEAKSYRNGYQYRCVVSNTYGSVYTESATLTVSVTAAPVITAQPTSLSVREGETAVFSVSATGGNLSYQWYFKTAAGAEWTKSSAAGAQTAQFPVNAQSYRNSYQYRCRIYNSEGSVYSKAATLTVLSFSAPVISSQPRDSAVPEGEKAVFRVTANGEDISYQWYFKTGQGAEWTKSSAAGAKTATFEVEAQSYRNGYQYRCKVTNPGGSVYTNTVTLTVLSTPAPIITEQLKSFTVEVNQFASFSVSAEGEDLQYQWYFRTGGTAEWTKCSGAASTTSSLSVEAKSYRNGYQYRCRVSNLGGSVYSAAATLHVSTRAATAGFRLLAI